MVPLYCSKLKNPSNELQAIKLSPHKDTCARANVADMLVPHLRVIE